MFGLVSAKRLKRANETIDRLQESIEIVKQDREVYFERCLQLRKENDGLRQRIKELGADKVDVEYMTAKQYADHVGYDDGFARILWVKASKLAKERDINIKQVPHPGNKNMVRNLYPVPLLREVAGF